jgi:hypothetical protein
MTMTDPGTGDSPPAIEAASATAPDAGERAQGYYAAYEEHSKTLRTWLVAYGIGAPVLLLTNESLSEKLTVASDGPLIGMLFLAGVVVQVLLAALNKALMWTCYFLELYPNRKRSRRHRLAFRLSKQFWIDLSADVVSLILFGYATWLAFNIVLSGVPVPSHP